MGEALTEQRMGGLTRESRPGRGTSKGEDLEEEERRLGCNGWTVATHS